MNTKTTDNVLQKKKWGMGVVQLHAEPPPTPVIKSKHDDMSDQDFVKIKFCRDPTSENLDLYEFKMALFDNIEPEEFFFPLFVI